MAGLAAEERAWLAEALRKEESPAGAEAREMLAVEQGEFEARYAGVLNAAACDEESKALANDPEADPAPSMTARWGHIARSGQGLEDAVVEGLAGIVGLPFR